MRGWSRQRVLCWFIVAFLAVTVPFGLAVVLRTAQLSDTVGCVALLGIGAALTAIAGVRRGRTWTGFVIGLLVALGSSGGSAAGEYLLPRNDSLHRGISAALVFVIAMHLMLLANAIVASACFAFGRGAVRGECARCGYDRRGIAADAVCPECGGK